MTNNTPTTSTLDTDQLSKFNLSVDYSHMRQNSLRPHSTPFKRSHTKSELDDPIKGYKIFPDNKKPPADVCYIKHMVSLLSSVEDNMYEEIREQLLRSYLWVELPHKGESWRRYNSNERLLRH